MAQATRRRLQHEQSLSFGGARTGMRGADQPSPKAAQARGTIASRRWPVWCAHMLFNSRAFLLVFLPLALLVYVLASRSERWRLPVLLLISIVFYGYWDVRFVPLIIGSIVINWCAARLFLKTKRSAVIVLAIVANLSVLAWFKYLDFLATSLGAAFGTTFSVLAVALPLGISFFTFHNIMYLTDLKDGKAPPYDLIRYGLYIAFFPQVLSGPLVRWSELVHQLDLPPFAQGWEARAVRGILFIVIGLAEKTFLGDRLAPLVETAFSAAANGAVPGALAWQGLLAFTFQIFFDFSGYTDIAIGLGLLLGVRLPDNFAAPYRATSLQDFWRRWHMTLSRFLRDYLYIRLGGNRQGLTRQLAAIMVTMALGGLWHGADWTFVAWGVLHGCGLAAGVLWRRIGITLPRLLGWALTFGFVMLAWVFFRAPTFAAAGTMFQALATLPWAGEFRGRTILTAAIAALVLPPTGQIVERLRLNPWFAVAAAIMFVAVLIDIGGDHGAEFIYFRF